MSRLRKIVNASTLEGYNHIASQNSIDWKVEKPMTHGVTLLLAIIQIILFAEIIESSIISTLENWPSLLEHLLQLAKCLTH